MTATKLWEFVHGTKLDDSRIDDQGRFVFDPPRSEPTIEAKTHTKMHIRSSSDMSLSTDGNGSGGDTFSASMASLVMGDAWSNKDIFEMKGNTIISKSRLIQMAETNRLIEKMPFLKETILRLERVCAVRLSVLAYIDVTDQ
jgi:hypothetical protein